MTSGRDDTTIRPGSGRGEVAELDTDHALALLSSQPVGRLAFWDGARVHIATVNHAVDGWSVVFRTSYGGKLIAASSESEVAFQADDYDPGSRTGWSVLVRGTAETVHDEELIERLDALDVDTWADTSPHDVWVRVHIEDVTGRHITRRS